MSAENSRRVYRFGSFVFDARSEQLSADGQRKKLSSPACKILLRLLENSGQVVEQIELKKAGWPHKKVVSDVSLRQTIRELREALGDSGRKQEIIDTVNNQGWRFLPDVEDMEAGRAPDEVDVGAQRAATEISPASSPAGGEQPALSKAGRGRARRLIRFLLLLAAVLLVSYGAVQLWHAHQKAKDDADFVRQQRAHDSYREGWRIYMEGDIYRGQNQEERAHSKYQEAEAPLRLATQLCPERPLYHSALGWDLFDEGRDKFDEARQEFMRVLELHPAPAEEADAHHGLGLTYEGVDDLEKAEYHLREAVNRSPDEAQKECREDLQRVQRKRGVKPTL